MPPVLGPVSPSPTRLWSCAVASGSDVLAVDQGEEARLLAFQELLDHDLGARRAERAGEAGVDGLLGLPLASRRSTTPLPAARPSALMTIGSVCAAR